MKLNFATLNLIMLINEISYSLEASNGEVLPFYKTKENSTTGLIPGLCYDETKPISESKDCTIYPIIYNMTEISGYLGETKILGVVQIYKDGKEKPLVSIQFPDYDYEVCEICIDGRTWTNPNGIAGYIKQYPYITDED